MVDSPIRGLTARQDDRLGRVVRKVEAMVGKPGSNGPGSDPLILASPVVGSEVYDRNRGWCNPMVGTGQRFQELLRRGAGGTPPDPVGGREATEFLTRDTTRTLDFINLTGGIIGEQDWIVLVRVTVPFSGSTTVGSVEEIIPGGMWFAVSGVNHIHYGRSTGTIAAGGTGYAKPLTEADIYGNLMPVQLFAAHGDQDISSSLEIIYVRRGQDRLIIGAECEPTTVTTPVGEDFLPVTPLDKAVVVSVDTDLSWDSIWTVFDVFFGQPGALVNVSSGQLAKTFEIPGSLEENTVYQWLVRSTDRRGDDVLSPLWSFTTGPNTPLKIAWATTMQTAMSLAGGAVTFDSQVWSQGVTTSFGLTGGRVEFAVSTGTWNALAIMTASLNKF